MLLLVRFVIIVLRSFVRRRVGVLEESVVRFTVLPHDCDLNFHLNGGRFLSFMDMARVELLGRTGLLRPMLRRRWRPVMGGAMIRYRRSILPFERFRVRSRVLGWDEKWFYLEQVAERGGEPCATAYARVLVRDANGNIAPAAVIGLLRVDIQSPSLPLAITRWCDAEDAR